MCSVIFVWHALCFLRWFWIRWSHWGYIVDLRFCTLSFWCIVRKFLDLGACCSNLLSGFVKRKRVFKSSGAGLPFFSRIGPSLQIIGSVITQFLHADFLFVSRIYDLLGEFFLTWKWFLASLILLMWILCFGEKACKCCCYRKVGPHSFCSLALSPIFFCFFGGLYWISLSGKWNFLATLLSYFYFILGCD